MSTLHSVIAKYREIFWVAAGQAASISGSIYFVTFMTENISVAAYGTLTLLLSLSSSLNNLIFGGISQGINRFYTIALQSSQLQQFILISYKFMIGGAIISLIIWVPIFQFFFITLPNGRLIAFLTIFYFFICGLNGAFNGIQNAARQRKIVAILLGMLSWSKIILFLPLSFLIMEDVQLSITTQLLAATIILCFQIYFTKQLLCQSKAKQEKKPNREKTDHSEGQTLSAAMIKFSLPMIAWGIFIAAHTASDRIFLNHIDGPEAVAYFSVLFQLGYSPIIILLAIVTTYFTPILYEKFGTGHETTRQQIVDNDLKKILRYAILLTVLCVITVSIFHKPIFKLLVAAHYLSISYLLPFMVAFGGIFSIGQILSLRWMIYQRNKDLMIIKIVSSLFGIIGNYYLILNYQLIGAVLGTGSFCILYLLLLIRFPIKMPANAS